MVNTTKSLSVKELRMNFPKIRKELEKGVSFTVIYRSKPIAELYPIDFISKPFGNKTTNKTYDFPDNMKDFLKDINKYTFKGIKSFNAVKLIRKDRGYDD